MFVIAGVKGWIIALIMIVFSILFLVLVFNLFILLLPVAIIIIVLSYLFKTLNQLKKEAGRR